MPPLTPVEEVIPVLRPERAPVGITITEHVESRRWLAGARPQVEFRFQIKGTDNDISARDALAAATATVYGDLPRQEAEIEPVWVDTVSGDGLWNAILTYGFTAILTIGRSEETFDTTGGTQHITHSIETVARYGRLGRTPPDFKGAIAVNDQGVQGVDIPLPVYRWTETHVLLESSVTRLYKGDLFRATGRINNAFFRGFEAGECLFLGAVGTPRNPTEREVTFKFAAQPNANDLRIGDIGGILKRGWDYLWVHYVQAEDNTARALVRIPNAVYVERVLRERDFGVLGIGVA